MAQQAGSWDEDRAFWSQAVPPKAKTRPAVRRIPTAVVTVLIALSLVIGFCATQGVMRAMDLFAAAIDAQTQVTTLEGIAKSGSFFNPTALATMQTSLFALDSDVLRVQADVPISALGTKGEEVTHAFRMATDLIRAGEYGVDAGQTMIPHLKGIMSGLSSKPSATASQPLTLDELQRVNGDVTSAGKLAQAALQERAQINDSDLQAAHLGSVVKVLDKLDTIAPKVPKYIDLATLGISALQPLLGIGTKTPAHYLLFDEDSDELRPTGGFLGNFALLTLDNGQLKGGLHLNNIYSFDCPTAHGRAFPAGCFETPMVAQYGWMNAGGDAFFGVRDSNLEPDFPISATYIEEHYTLEVTGKGDSTAYVDAPLTAALQKAKYPSTVDGVFAFTPQFIGKILDVLGGITVPVYNVHVTSANLTDYIHYYHVLFAYCGNKNYGNNDPKACAVIQKTIKGGQKGFDAEIGTLVMHAAATASPSVQGKIMKAALDSLRTRDLQLYFNNPQLESLLQRLNLDDALPKVQGDQAMVEDVNVGATYANADLEEHVTDTVTLNADGSATHDMTVAYDYPWKNHLYNEQSSVDGNSIYIDTTENYWYAAVARVIVPENSNFAGETCFNGTYSYGNFFPDVGAINNPPPNRSSWSCHMFLNCYNCGYDGKDNGQPAFVLTQEYHWTTLATTKTAKGIATYDYTFVHQAGGHPTLTITIYGPNGKKLTVEPPPVESTPLLGAPPAPVLKHVSNGGVQYGGTNGALLTQDVTLSVSYKA